MDQAMSGPDDGFTSRRQTSGPIMKITNVLEHGKDTGLMATQHYGTSKLVSRNNDEDLIYFSNFHIRKHIDVVRYSVYGSKDETVIYRIIESIGYKRVSHHKIPKGNYLFKATFKHHGDIAIVDIIHELKSEEDGLPPMLISVHDPNQELINLLSSSCAYHGMDLMVSKIELAYDFYVKDRIDFYDFLKDHVYLKYSRSRPSEETYVRTFYFNQIKNSSRGLKEYLKADSNGQKFVRLELTLKRKALQKLEINPSLKTIDAVNPFRYFKFMSFDENKLMKHLKWKSRKTHKTDISSNKELHDELLERHVENWMDAILLAPYSLMGKVVRLKSEHGVENYSRFLVPLKDFTEKFIEKTECQAFLPTKIEN